MNERENGEPHQPNMEMLRNDLFAIVSGGVRVGLELGQLARGPYEPEKITAVLLRRMMGEKIDGLEKQLLDA